MWKPAILASVGGLVMLVACASGEPASSGCGGGMVCENGAGTLQACFTADSNGACTGLYYKVGSMVFDCVSCDDQAYCANAAQVACGVPEASIPGDADLPDGVSLAGDGGPPGEASTRGDGALD